MKILVIGSGGREHALTWKFFQNGHSVFCTPGNPGTEAIATNVAIQATDIPELLIFARNICPDLVVVGPEEPLFMGIVNTFTKEGFLIFGPPYTAALIEESKAFARDVMYRAYVPQPQFCIGDEYKSALAYIRARNTPCFIKADGPALGKGALPCKTLAEAETALRQIMVEKKFGDSGRMVIIEEWLLGDELSAHAVCDREDNFIMFPFSRDYKRALSGDEGDNTGGMGAVVPITTAFDTISKTEELIRNTLRVLRKGGVPFQGLLYPGIMLTKAGPKVLEFNVRFGDPETQVYMRHLESDLTDLLVASVEKTLNEVQVKWRGGFSVCVVLASGGYPGTYEKGFPIEGIGHAEQVPGVAVFHAGTAIKDKILVTNGGRVLNVTCHAETLPLALERVYSAVSRIHFQDMRFRTDIGKSLLGK